MQKIKINLRSTEEELCKLREKLDKCVKERNRLNEIKGTLEMDLMDTKSKLADEKLCTCRMKEKFKLELETLSNELKIKCRKLSDMHVQYDEVNSKINDGKCKMKSLTASLNELKEVSEKTQCEMKNQIQKLKEESCLKDDDICRLKKKVKELGIEYYGNNCTETHVNS